MWAASLRPYPPKPGGAPSEAGPNAFFASLRRLRAPRAVPARRFALFAVLVVLSLLIAAPAFAGCAKPESDPRCRPDFDHFGAVAWIGDEYVAVGHVRNRPGSAWALMHISADGHAGPMIEIPPWGDHAGEALVPRYLGNEISRFESVEYRQIWAEVIPRNGT